MIHASDMQNDLHMVSQGLKCDCNEGETCVTSHFTEESGTFQATKGSKLVTSVSWLEPGANGCVAPQRIPAHWQHQKGKFVEWQECLQAEGVLTRLRS